MAVAVKKSRSKKPKKLTRVQRIAEDKRYLKRLNEFIDRVFEASVDKGWTEREFAEKSGVSMNTISRYNNYHVRDPHLYTIYLMACAVGLESEMPVRSLRPVAQTAKQHLTLVRL